MSFQDLKTYYKNVSQGRTPPKDPFGLSHSFLTQDETNILVGDLADKQAMLSYLGDDMMVSLYQLDVDILTRMRNMGLRDEKFLPVFVTIYDGWLGTLKITRAKDGMERYMQANAVGGYIPSTSMMTGGYGGQIAEDIRKKEEEQAKKGNPIRSFMDKFFNKSKK